MSVSTEHWTSYDAVTSCQISCVPATTVHTCYESMVQEHRDTEEHKTRDSHYDMYSTVTITHMTEVEL